MLCALLHRPTMGNYADVNFYAIWSTAYTSENGLIITKLRGINPIFDTFLYSKYTEPRAG